MLIQPFVENSIRHGLLPRDGIGSLEVRIEKEIDNSLIFTIADDGIGIEEAGRLSRKSPFRYVSRGRELTLGRIEILNELGYFIDTQIVSSAFGTRVIIRLKRK